MDIKELLKLSPADFQMVLQGLEALKSKDVAGDLMIGMFDAVLSKKPEEMTEEERAKHERRQIEKAYEQRIKEEKREKFKREIDLLKAKITLIVEMNTEKHVAGSLAER